MALEHREMFAAIQANEVVSAYRLPYGDSGFRCRRDGRLLFGIGECAEDLLDERLQLRCRHIVVADVRRDNLRRERHKTLAIGNRCFSVAHHLGSINSIRLPKGSSTYKRS